MPLEPMAVRAGCALPLNGGQPGAQNSERTDPDEIEVHPSASVPLAAGLLVATLLHIEPWVGVDLSGNGRSTQVHDPAMARLAPEQEA